MEKTNVNTLMQRMRTKAVARGKQKRFTTERRQPNGGAYPVGDGYARFARSFRNGGYEAFRYRLRLKGGQ